MTVWTIYYDDGSTFTHLNGDPVDAPPFGMVVIAQKPVDKPRSLIHGTDFYYWNSDEGEWWGTDWTGVLDRMLNRLPLSALLQGRMVSDTKYRETLRRADRDHIHLLKQ